jgi:hypothetical protein
MDYRNAKYINDQGVIDCEIDHPEFGWIPYTLDLSDTDMTINNADLLEQMQANDDVSAYAPATEQELIDQAALKVRAERDFYLISYVDPIAGNALRWADLTEDEQNQVILYRNALLDVPQQQGFPFAVTFPEKPIFI